VATSTSAARTAKSLITVDEALSRILARISPLESVELPLLDALGSVLAETVVADRDVPPFNNSAMDGYAVRGADVAKVPAKLDVIGSIAAGTMPVGTVGAGQAMRFMTGAPLPKGADTVVRVEDTDNGESVVTITHATSTGTAVRRAAEDHRRGDTVVPAGKALRAAEIGVLATVGRARVSVIRRPNVAIVSTGDELGIVRDTPSDLRHALGNAAFGDVVLTSGGVSVGDHDHVKPVVDSMGSIDFWSIALRPGRPLAFGELKTKRGNVPLFGLPGNPVSALLTFELFVRPALLKMAGHTKLRRPRAKARLEDRIDKPTGLRTFARGIYDGASGTVRSTGPQGSGILGSMSAANCLIDLGADVAGADRGETVDVVLTDLPEDH
jgi:molybdopterin molybdotransferase